MIHLFQVDFDVCSWPMHYILKASVEESVANIENETLRRNSEDKDAIQTLAYDAAGPAGPAQSKPVVVKKPHKLLQCPKQTEVEGDAACIGLQAKAKKDGAAKPLLANMQAALGIFRKQVVALRVAALELEDGACDAKPVREGE